MYSEKHFKAVNHRIRKIQKVFQCKKNKLCNVVNAKEYLLLIKAVKK